MAQLGKTALFAGFDATITTNGNNEITGAILNAELKNIGDSYPNKLDEDHFFLREYNASRNYLTGFVCIESGVILKANKATSGAFESEIDSDGEFAISITQESDCSYDGGYTFEDVTSTYCISKDDAKHLIEELQHYVYSSTR